MMDRTTPHSATLIHSLPLNPGAQALPLFAAVGTALESIEVSGPEAAKFLQGQVTCDLNEIVAGQVRLGAHCNPKGRAQASFLAWATPGSAADTPVITLLLPPGMAAPTHAQLKKFAMFSKATLQVQPAAAEHATTPSGASSSVAVLLGGVQAQNTLSAWGLPVDLPTQALVSLALPGSEKGTRVAALDDTHHWFLLLVQEDALDALMAALPANTPVAGQNGWWQCLNALGQTHVFPSTQEEFIPQELNYDLTQGIHFKKGCYKGQEIIARLHFKGTPKFRTGRYQWQSATAPAIGMSLADPEGHRVGQVAQVAESPDGYDVLLVVKPEDPRLEQALHINEGETVHLSRLPLPYSL